MRRLKSTLLAAMIASATSISLRAADLPSKVTTLNPESVTVMMANQATLSGNLKIRGEVTGFETPQDAVTWIVNAPKDDQYAVSLIYNTQTEATLEVSSGTSALSAPSILKTWEGKPGFWRQELPGTLALKEGENRITFHLKDTRPVKSGEKTTDENPSQDAKKSPSASNLKSSAAFHLYSVELGTPAIRDGQLKRAKEIKGDASWMVAGKYGLFVHFSAMSYPYEGEERRGAWFQKSVEMFDVKAFADAVERTGAAWVIFTATHQGFYWPGPNAAVDKILPGRTTKRDLLGEIIDELGHRGIRTLFYLHTGYNGYETEFWKAAGAEDADTKRFSDNIAAILRDCSLRYGKKLSGFGYIDGALTWLYPLNPSWEDWARAIKAGNPSAVVGFSSNGGPTVSPFNELAVTDSQEAITRPDPQLIGPGKQLGDVTPATWFYMDSWFFKKPPNGKFTVGPRHPTKEYVSFFQKMAEEQVPVTINMAMTGDVVADHPIFNPKCMAAMEEVRKAIRGK